METQGTKLKQGRKGEGREYKTKKKEKQMRKDRE